ncbi:hypothetical protein KCU78_g77, partial [Aureobasidium melanogenum]
MRDLCLALSAQAVLELVHRDWSSGGHAVVLCLFLDDFVHRLDLAGWSRGGGGSLVGSNLGLDLVALLVLVDLAFLGCINLSGVLLSLNLPILEGLDSSVVVVLVTFAVNDLLFSGLVLMLDMLMLDCRGNTESTTGATSGSVLACVVLTSSVLTCSESTCSDLWLNFSPAPELNNVSKSLLTALAAASMMCDLVVDMEFLVEKCVNCLIRPPQTHDDCCTQVRHVVMQMIGRRKEARHTRRHVWVISSRFWEKKGLRGSRFRHVHVNSRSREEHMPYGGCSDIPAQTSFLEELMQIFQECVRVKGRVPFPRRPYRRTEVVQLDRQQHNQTSGKRTKVAQGVSRADERARI